MPKTYKHLYPQITAYDNLYQAHRQESSEFPVQSSGL